MVAAGILTHGTNGMRLAIGTVTETEGFAAMCRAFHSRSLVVNQRHPSWTTCMTPAVRASPFAVTMPMTMKFSRVIAFQTSRS